MYNLDYKILLVQPTFETIVINLNAEYFTHVGHISVRVFCFGVNSNLTVCQSECMRHRNLALLETTGRFI